MPQLDVDTDSAVPSTDLLQRVAQELAVVYTDGDVTADMEALAAELLRIMRLQRWLPSPDLHVNHWDQRDALMITYADSIVSEGEPPLQTLKH
jgi:sucrose phosphorylase